MTKPGSRVLVTDFDGTMTKHDFYELVASRLLPANMRDFWAEYRAGRLTHFEALRGYFSAIRSDEASVWRIVEQMEIDPQLAVSVGRLQQSGWKVVVASAGCQWYIERLLSQAGVEVEVHANPGHFQTAQGLLMELPRGAPFFSPTHGIDKAGVVQQYRSTNAIVAFAGDGYPDVEAAELMPDRLRFARGDLARVLAKSGHAFHHFNTWSDIAKLLVVEEGEWR